MIDEGYIKFDIDWTEGEPPDADLIGPLEEWRSILFDAGLIGHYADLGIGYGNLSMRLTGDEFVISATQTGHLAQTTAEHYCRVTGFDIDANSVQCRGPLKASSESMTHAAIYAQDAAIRAIVHVHDDALWSWALARIPATGADVAYGTPAMAREFQRLVADPGFDGVAVMAGHEGGLIAVGDSVAAAARRIIALKAESGT